MIALEDVEHSMLSNEKQYRGQDCPSCQESLTYTAKTVRYRTDFYCESCSEQVQVISE